MVDYVSVLYSIADSVETQNVDPFVESAALREIAEYLRVLEQFREDAFDIYPNIDIEIERL